MKNTGLPPQAYTRETLAHAYDWLKQQPEAIKSRATSADELVSLYLSARRHRYGSTTAKFDNAPVSSENFKNDLKNLAKDLEEFSPKPEEAFQAAPSFEIEPKAPQVSFSEPTLEPTHKSSSQSLDIDEKSETLLKEVQEKLNLSCPQEAFRMLICLGFDKLKEVLPRN